MSLRETLASGRRLLLDGGFGTMIQSRRLDEKLPRSVRKQYRSLHFASLPKQQTGNNDLLCLSRPDIVEDIHRAYLDAGADIITTNTFNAQRISQADYGCEHLVADINLQAARMARRLADDYANGQPRFVAGSVGPTNKTLSLSPDVDDPAARSLTFDQLADAYQEQMEALITGGVDALLIETVFDTLNAKAALYAAQQAMARTRRVEIMLSATISDRSMRTLSGQTIEAFVAAVGHAPLLSIGLNCGFGAAQMLPALQRLAAVAPCYVSAHPNAGLPNAAGEYEQTPGQMADDCRALIPLTHIIGGCCGTTPRHIAALRPLVDSIPVRPAGGAATGLTLSGLDHLDYSAHGFVAVGERCNVAGSRKFLRLIKEKDYDQAIAIACAQVRSGAMVIDVNLDDPLIDSRTEMRHFLNLLASEPEAARVPVMVDSSSWEVIVDALKCLQGKGIVNSLSLKEGEEAFVGKARQCHALGAAVVVMLMDERGQATDHDRRCEIAARAYRLLTQEAGLPPHDIIFDPNVLTVATGIDEHNAYAAHFISAVAWIKSHLPGVQISGGISNLSFAFRGNNALREAMHAVFLHHARKAGLNMAIVNAATRVDYSAIDPGLRSRIEDVILNTRPDAADRLLEVASQGSAAIPATAGGGGTPSQGNTQLRACPCESGRTDGDSRTKPETQQATVGQRLIDALVAGDPSHLEHDLADALAAWPSPSAIIDGPLMQGMRHVGELFAGGAMFLPQVVKTARTMKRAVAILEPHIKASNAGTASAGHVLLATVKGDVHDIGKNIVGVVMTCGGYRVTDLGVMVEPQTIVEAALRLRPDIIALSGLITPSLAEMVRTAQALKEAGVSCPLMIGGATTSPLHTALRIAPAYDGPVIHVADAAQNTPLANRFLNPATSCQAAASLHLEQARLCHDHLASSINLTPISEARAKKPDWFKGE